MNAKMQYATGVGTPDALEGACPVWGRAGMKPTAARQQGASFDSHSKTSNNATLRASHAGIASNARTSLSSTGSCEPKASPNVKPPKSSRFLERPFKPGGYGTTPSISFLMAEPSFKAALDLPFYTGW